MGTRINPKNTPEALNLQISRVLCFFWPVNENLPFSVFLRKFGTKLGLSRPSNAINNKALLFLRRLVNVGWQ